MNIEAMYHRSECLGQLAAILVPVSVGLAVEQTARVGVQKRLD